MPNRNDCWGIEVGANAIKAIRLVRKKSEILVADYEIMPFKKILTTPDINVDEAIQVNLDQFLSQHSVSKSSVVISVPGHMAFARFAKLPPVDPKKIPDIVRFEAVQQIPFPIDQVEWDYQVFSRADSPDVEVGIVAITKERVAQYLNNYFSVGLSVDGLTLSPMAVYNALAYDLDLTPESPGVILVDIGTIATDLIVVDNGQVWLRTLPIGGNNFTEALVRAFKLSFPKAERLKREAGTSKYARQIFQAMRPVFADLVQEMQRSLGYYGSLYRDAKLTKLIGVGSTFRLPGMQKFLKQQLQIEVERPAGFHRVKIAGKEESAFAENAMNLTTAYGLALQGLELEKVSVNILPTHLVRQRVWRDKGIWFGAAAGLMVGAVGIAGAKLFLDKTAYTRAFDAVNPDVTSVENDAHRNIDAWNRAAGQNDPRGQIENLRAILDYRDVMPKMMEDLDLAAKSLNPQKELYDSEYDEIRKIPRTERRRIMIESVTTEYHFEKLPEPKTDTMVAAPAAPTQALPTRGNTAGATIKPTIGTPGTPAAPAFASWKANEASPYFVVTIKGTAPFKNAPDILAGVYVKWLQNNAIRADRPYRIVAGSDAIQDCSQADTPFVDSDSNTNTPPPASPDAASSGGPGATDGMGGATPGAGGNPARPDTWDVKPEQTTSADLRPVRPLGHESKVQDWHFTIVWKVQLVMPSDVRHVQDSLNNAEVPAVIPTATPAPPPPAPAPHAAAQPVAPHANTEGQL